MRFNFTHFLILGELTVLEDEHEVLEDDQGVLNNTTLEDEDILQYQDSIQYTEQDNIENLYSIYHL